jgi:hypothetical protein
LYLKLHGRRMAGPVDEPGSEVKSGPSFFSGALKSCISNFY